MPTFKQFKAEELFLGTDETAQGALYGSTYGFAPTGTEFFDQFLKSLYKYGMKLPSFHARVLNVDGPTLFAAFPLLTGKSISKFMEDCILLMAMDLLPRTPSTKLNNLSDRLGFAAYTSFSAL